MKKYLKWAIIPTILIIALLSLPSFDVFYRDYEPVLMTRENMEAAVQLREAREIEKPGKIWVYNQFIFVIEQYKGVHVIDNTDPANPMNVAFIQIDGCTDVAVKTGLIYANNAVDLIGIKPAPDYKSIQVVSRNRNVLPELIAPDGRDDYGFKDLRPDNTIIVRWDPYKSN